MQIAAAWVLACVFVRFSEDNGLIPDAWLSGPGDRLAEAQDRHDDFFRRNPSLNDRDWLLASFEALGKSHRTVAGLFDPAHNPLFEVLPSYEAATALLAFWRRRGADGEVVHDFTDGELNTRFLGDLYQDLSEHARKTYALLQTPVFVEEFILDLTLEPAVEEFGLTPAWKHRPSGWDGEVFADGPGWGGGRARAALHRPRVRVRALPAGDVRAAAGQVAGGRAGDRGVGAGAAGAGVGPRGRQEPVRGGHCAVLGDSEGARAVLAEPVRFVGVIA
ncbi:hypothetical protein ACPB9I_05595 [Streptomyces cellulosae]